jgi:hypothetical protein
MLRSYTIQKIEYSLGDTAVFQNVIINGKRYRWNIAISSRTVKTKSKTCSYFFCESGEYDTEKRCIVVYMADDNDLIHRMEYDMPETKLGKEFQGCSWIYKYRFTAFGTTKKIDIEKPDRIFPLDKYNGKKLIPAKVNGRLAQLPIA